ncbi:MAG: glutamate--tRNA ligase, partial [Myxococcota bacterium]
MTRVRFAPSPTGSLHIGGVRTALYCWLYARQTGGQFVLRIEDTDAARSTDEATQVVLESMRWLGLDWDEGPEVGGDAGPYFQTERLGLYKEYADKLIASGHAYRCYATKEEIAEMRAAYEKASGGKRGFRFRSPWRDRTDGDPNVPHSVRFKTPLEGETGWDDVLRGPISVSNTEQQDFVLLRPNGLPLYNFGCAVDDITMKMTLVARGDDHMVNTPLQILIYKALGAELPRFAHLPMVHGPDGKKLAKRHASVGVLEYRDLGYLPDGVINYLARLGWSHGDQEIFTRQELIEKFSWEHVGVTAGRYDGKKFEHVQAQHLRMLDDAELATGVVPWLKKRGLDVAPDDRKLIAAIAPVQLRCATFIELADGLDYFFRPDDALTYEEKGQRKFMRAEDLPQLKTLRELVAAADPFDAETLEASIKGWIERDALKMKAVAQPARMALTGRTKSPGLYETLVILGRESSLARIDRAIAVIEG